MNDFEKIKIDRERNKKQNFLRILEKKILLSIRIRRKCNINCVTDAAPHVLLMLRLLVLQRGLGGLHPACWLLHGNITGNL